MDTVKVYDSFELKKELGQKLIRVKQARKKILDSLMLDLKILSKDIEIESENKENKKKIFHVMRDQYLLKEQRFKEDNQVLTQRYNDQIWAQLNQYIKDYGERHNYQYIFGTTGQGTLMYAAKSYNVTDDILIYVNKRYNGEKK